MGCAGNERLPKVYARKVGVETVSGLPWATCCRRDAVHLWSSTDLSSVAPLLPTHGYRPRIGVRGDEEGSAGRRGRKCAETKKGGAGICSFTGESMWAGRVSATRAPPAGAHKRRPYKWSPCPGLLSYQPPMPVATATTNHECGACRLGVVDFERTHLHTPPWVPGFPGTTGLGLYGIF